MKKHYPLQSIVKSFIVLFMVFGGVNLILAKDTSDYFSLNNTIQSANTALTPMDFETSHLLGHHLTYKYALSHAHSDNKQWRISISMNGDEHIGFNTTRAPVGCFDKSKDPIDTLELTVLPIAYSQGKKTNKIVIFCGSDGGHHSTVYFINPLSNDISTLDVGNMPLHLIKENDAWYIDTLQEYYDIENNLRLSYILIRKISIFDTNRNLEISIADDNFSRRRYLGKIIENPKNKNGQYQNLIYFGLSKSKTEFCNLSKRLGKENIQKFLSQFNFPSCSN